MQTSRTNPALKWLLAFLIGGPLILAALLVVVVASFFWVGPEVRALRNSVIDSSPQNWDKVVELSFGRGTFGMANLASAFIKEIPPEARAAIQSARSGEVSVYHYNGSKPVGAALLEKADRKMAERGWYRAVGVLTENETVAVYFPSAMREVSDVEACVLFLDREQLVCVSARTDLQPLMRIAHEHLESTSLALLPRE